MTPEVSRHRPDLADLVPVERHARTMTDVTTGSAPPTTAAPDLTQVRLELLSPGPYFAKAAAQPLLPHPIEQGTRNKPGDSRTDPISGAVIGKNAAGRGGFAHSGLDGTSKDGQYSVLRVQALYGTTVLGCFLDSSPASERLGRLPELIRSCAAIRDQMPKA